MKKYILFFALLTSSASQAIINGTSRPENIQGTVYERVGNLRDNVRGTFCKGLLIFPRIVISAAHCAIDLSLSTQFVLLDQNGEKKFHEVLHVEVPRLYSAKDDFAFADIAVIVLQRPVKEEPSFKMIKLLSEPLTEGSQGQVYGGRHYPHGNARFTSENSKPYELQSATLQFQKTFQSTERAVDHVVLKSVKTENQQEGKICFVDSGGPYLIEQNGVDYLAGVTSSILNQKNIASNDQSETEFQFCMGGDAHMTLVPFYYSWLKKTIQNLSEQYALEKPLF